MSAVQPVAVYALRIPPGDVLIPAVPEFAAMFRVTMAAIDPSEEISPEDLEEKRPARATLKVVRVSDDLLDDDDSDDDDFEDDDEDESSDEEVNGGPSNKKSSKRALLEALAADVDEDEEMGEDDDDELDAAAEIKKIIADAKGKGKAIEGDSDEDDDDDDDDDSEEGIELDECVLCTLDPERHFQQPIDFVVNEGEKIFFKVSGTHTVHLTGNYVMPLDDGEDSDDDEAFDDEEGYGFDEDEYDLSPDDEELGILEDEIDDDESDELDDLADPRITELDDEPVIEKKASASKKGKNKRPAEESDDDETADLDAIMAKSIKKDGAAVNGEPAKPLTKAEKKAAKKLKKNDGEAAKANPAADNKKKEEDAATATPSSDKKVQFAKNIIQGPTPAGTPLAKKDDKKAANKTTTSGSGLGIRDVSGVTVDDRKLGSGPAAKKGSRLEMRYVGKLEDGKVFDSNKSGTPFKLKVGVGEVIKGWDIGLTGITAGGERRLTIPAHLAYGNKALPGIPKNSKLIFDVKCLSVK